MLNVLHVIWSARFGGKEKLVFDLINAQSKHPEINVSILICQKTGEFLNMFQQAGQGGLRCYFGNLNSGFDFSLFKYIKIFHLFRVNKIIHIHSFNPVIALIAVLSKNKIIYSFHGDFRFRKRNAWRDYIKFIILKKFLNSKVNYISFNSHFTKRIAERRFGLNAVKRSVIYNGIAFENYVSNQDRIDKSILMKIDNKFVVGTASRFIKPKRIDLLIDAFCKFQNNKNAILILVGDGVLKNKLKQISIKSGASDKILFLGYKDNIKEYLNLVDICVIPSINDGFGLVALEALLLGKPTIVFRDGGGLVEIVGGLSRDDIVKDVDDLIKRMNYYFDNRERINLKRKERINYALKYNISYTSERFNGIYNKIVLAGGINSNY